MISFRNRIFLFLTGGKYSGMQDEREIDGIIRLIVLNITYAIVALIILALGVTDMRRGFVDQGLLQIILGFLILSNLLLLRTEFPFIVGGHIVTSLYGVFCGMTLFTRNGTGGFDCVWIYSYPLMSIFALGLPRGLIPALGLFGVVCWSIFVSGATVVAYTLPAAAMICGVYIFVMALTVIYEVVRSIKDKWLASQDNYMNRVFASSPDVMLILDQDNCFLYCSDIFLRRIHAKNFEALRKRNCLEVFRSLGDTAQIDNLASEFRLAIDEKSPMVVERVIDLGGDGRNRNYEIHFTPMFNNSGLYQGAFIFLHDTTEISNAKQRAEAANAAKSNFLANMSHEIRTPLHAIIGMTAIAKNTPENIRRDYCLEKIEDASTHLLEVINDILDMSKIEADKFELSLTEFDVTRMLHRVAAVFELKVAEKKQTLTVTVGPDIPPRIISDELRLSQVITNLLANAVKFTPEGGSIAIALRRLHASAPRIPEKYLAAAFPDRVPSEAPGTETGDDGLETQGLWAAPPCTLEVRVTDTGIGIAPEQQAALFQPFQQVDGSISRKFGGTGLGLAISKRIVEMMNGTIRIESDTGKGAAFIFTIQVELPVELPAPLPAPSPEAPPAQLPADDFTGRRILLVEDVEINREIVTTILEPLGLVIEEVADGQIAYDTFSTNPEAYDLIFMDIHMPGMDGYESTRLIRALEHPRARTVPIIAMTANVFKEDVEKCLAAGMDGHLGKPIDFNEVMGLLRKYFC
ncbi:hypothetical protein AGMMS4952_20070 [Spirochaetia bacterium]|nr:hypothetical protein AGMMS4952_20070 [Spirochaetia bacterium]